MRRRFPLLRLDRRRREAPRRPRDGARQPLYRLAPAGKASRYTSRRLPVALAAAWEMEDASAARRMEWRIKQLTRTQKLALVGGGALPALEPA